MTGVELERIARAVVPPIGATGWRITVLATRPTTDYAVVPILFGRVDGAPVLRGSQADCHRFMDLLEGRAATPRSGRDFAEGAMGAPSRGHGRIEPPEPGPARRSHPASDSASAATDIAMLEGGGAPQSLLAAAP